MTDIVLVNRSTVLQHDAIIPVVPVLQTLFDRDFEPVWQTGLKVTYSFSANGKVPSGEWPIFLEDTTDVPYAGGYHDKMETPYARVFVRDAMEAGESWTVDLSHEANELCANPMIDTIIDLPGMPGYACFQEVCDAVEDDSLGYMIDNVLVSDWCTPAYFFKGGKPKKDTVYDFMGHLQGPAPELMKGGYLGIRDPKGNWGQVTMFDQYYCRPSRRSMRLGRTYRAARAHS